MYTVKELEVFTDMPFYVFLKDEEGKYVWCNKFFLDIAGVAALDEIIGKTDYDLIWSEHAERLRSADKGVLDGGKSINLQEHVNVAGRGPVTGNSCKFPATVEGKKCLFGVSIILD